MKQKLLCRVLWCAIVLAPVMKAFSQTGPVVWNGSVNNSWSVAGNWTPAVVPDNTSQVSIVPSVNQPLITTDAAANTLTLGANTSLTVQSGSDLTLTNLLTVNNTANFVVESGANLLQLDNIANLGAITIRRNSSALVRLDYTLWSAPVAGQNLLSFSPQTLVNRFYSYTAETNVYSAITPATNNFAIAQGYLVRMPNNHPTSATVWNAQFNGIPNNGNYQITMSNSGAGLAYNLVGNPYPSALDIVQFVSDNHDNITGTLYFWRETNGNTPNNAYCTWAGGTFTSNGEAQATDPEGIIQTGQGFFVEAKPGQTALQFKNSQRVGNNTSAFFRNADTVERNTIWLNVTNAAGAFSQMAVGYITGATSGADIFDGKHLSEGTLSLNSILNETDYVIQGRPLPFVATDVVPLSFKTTTSGNYTISIDHAIGLFTGDQDIFIKDNVTGIIHNLKISPYAFNSNAGSFNNRFQLQYQMVLDTFTPLQSNAAVTIYKQQNELIISSANHLIENVKLFDISGRLLLVENRVDSQDAHIAAPQSNGVVLVVVTLDGGQTATKKIIN